MPLWAGPDRDRKFASGSERLWGWCRLEETRRLEDEMDCSWVRVDVCLGSCVPLRSQATGGDRGRSKTQAAASDPYLRNAAAA